MQDSNNNVNAIELYKKGLSVDEITKQLKLNRVLVVLCLLNAGFELTEERNDQSPFVER